MNRNFPKRDLHLHLGSECDEAWGGGFAEADFIKVEQISGEDKEGTRWKQKE